MVPALLPCRVELGFQTITVSEVLDLDPDTAGEYQSASSSIKISAHLLNDLARANTLVHECFHAAFKQSELGKILDDREGDKEEMIVSVLANTVVELLRRNPKLLLFLNSAVRD